MRMHALKKGDIAPDFGLRNQEGEDTRLADMRGKSVLVYFYPRADTPGCTTQAKCVRDGLEDLERLGVEVVGVSPDEPSKQKKFDQKHHLGFTLLSDTDHAAAEAYGVWREKSMYGKKLMGIVRSSFLIDGEGKVQEAWYKVSRSETVKNVLSVVRK